MLCEVGRLRKNPPNLLVIQRAVIKVGFVFYDSITT